MKGCVTTHDIIIDYMALLQYSSITLIESSIMELAQAPSGLVRILTKLDLNYTHSKLHVLITCITVSL